MVEESKTQRYIEGIHVYTSNQAKELGNKLSWKILELLAEKGTDGLTAIELIKHFKGVGKEISTPTMYLRLNNLSANELISNATRRKDVKWGAPLKSKTSEHDSSEEVDKEPRKTAKIYYETCDTVPNIEKDFRESLSKLLDTKFRLENEELQKRLFKIVSEIVKEYKTDKNLMKYFPKLEYCNECEINHRGEEFLLAILFWMSYACLANGKWGDLVDKPK